MSYLHEARNRLATLLPAATKSGRELEWLDDFEKLIVISGPTRLTNSLVMLGIEDHQDCPLDDDVHLFLTYEDHKEFHQIYNWIVWKLLRDHNKLHSCATVLRRDLKVRTESSVSLGLPVGDEYGAIALKSYSKMLLEKFLRARPNQDLVYFKGSNTKDLATVDPVELGKYMDRVLEPDLVNEMYIRIKAGTITSIGMALLRGAINAA